MASKNIITNGALSELILKIKTALKGKSDTDHYHQMLNLYGSNGVSIGSSATGDSTNPRVWINYRDKPSTTAEETNNATAITSYCFGNRRGSTSGVTLYAESFTGNSASATKATQDSAGQQITTNYIKALSVNGKVITYTKGDGNTGTITTQDTVYTHPNTSGYKHIPSGGSSEQVLRWSADGTAEWSSDKTYVVTFGTCDTEAKTTAKTVTMDSFELISGGMVCVKFTNYVPAGATLNINSTGDIPIYYNGSAIIDDIITEGNMITFVYDGSYYHVIAADRMTKVTDTIEDSATTVPSGAAITSKFNGLMDDLFTTVSTWE